MTIANLTPEQLYGQMFDTTTGAVRTTGSGGGASVVGPGTAAAAARVTLASDDPGVVALAPLRNVFAQATFTPAATSHTAGDCNGAAGTFAFGAISGGIIRLTSASILINSGTAEATAWRCYLYNVTPPSAIADDGAWDLASGDQSAYIGFVDLFTAIDLGSTQYNKVTGLCEDLKLSGTGAFGYLVNLTTLTPAAVAHVVTLIGTQG